MEFLPLSRLMAHGRPVGAAVASDGEIVHGWKSFVAGVSGLANALTRLGAGRWMLFCEDSYAFAVGLLAAWEAGCTVVLPPNAQLGSVAETSSGITGLITDRSPSVKGLEVVAPLGHPGPARSTWRELNPDTVCLELFTSGSTGDRKSVPKTIGHLETEIACLENRWGPQIAGAEVFATVSHQHIYGLLYRVLWPLCAGRAFSTRTYFFPQDLLARMREVGRCCLISGPAHLKRMPDLLDVSGLGTCCRALFSSGGLLETPDAIALLDQAGITPYEVLGSTETGGVAWRRQDRTEESRVWHVLEGVAVEAENDTDLLKVRSSCVSVVAPGAWFAMGDRVEMLGPRAFRLLGRGDRIVKIEEERLSLPDMEQRLAEHRLVDHAAVFPVHKSQVSPGRTQLAAAVVLSEEGRAILSGAGRRDLTAQLRGHLLGFFSTVLMPRFWRYVDTLPRDSQGKVTLEELRRLVDNGTD